MANASSREQRLKQALLKRKSELWGELRREYFDKLGKEYAEQFDDPADFEELSLRELIENTGIKLAEIKMREVTALEEALIKLEEGSYGVCDDCGKLIPEERLAALPYATRCVGCAEEDEQQ